jgi:hypothetical protein
VKHPTKTGPTRRQAARALAVLRDAERALGAVRALDMRPPLGDGDLGGGPELDLYLGGDEPAAAYPDMRMLETGVDRASAFGLLADRSRGPACARASDVHRVVAQAALLGLDAAVHEGVLAVQSSYFASLHAPCPALEFAAVDDIQRHPDRALLGGDRRRMDGGLLWPAFLDDAYGDDPGALMTRLVAASSQTTPAGSPTWINEPDVLDTLRRILPARGQQLVDAMGAFAAARAFVGSRGDGMHIRDTERYGDMGRVRFEWTIDADTLPRRVAPAHPVEPTGASYVFVDLTKGTKPTGLILDADWEESFVYQWLALRLDAKGRETGRHSFGGVFGQDRAQLTLEDLRDTSYLAIVATSIGNDDRKKPYDPEDGAPRASSYELTIHAQNAPAPGGSRSD